MDTQFPKTGQGPAKLATIEDLERDKVGFTHPNLHQRVDPVTPPEDCGEYQPRDYQLGIYNVNLYRTTESHYHSEEANDIEIP